MSRKKRQERKEKRKEKREERTNKRQDRKEKRQEKFKKVINKLADKVRLVGQDIPFAPLLPFKKLMKNRLDEKGIPHDNSLKDVSIQFARSIGSMNNFEEMAVAGLYGDSVEGRDNALGKVGGGIVNAGIQAGTGNVTGAVSTVIKTIVEYFRNLKERKAKGETLSKDEEKLLSQAEDTAEAVKESAEEYAENTVAEKLRDFIFSWKGALSLLVLLVIVWMAFFR